MEKLSEIVEKLFSNNIISSLIIILISIFLYQFIRKIILSKKEKGIEKKISNRNKTYIKIIISLIRYSFILITILLVLKINGVNVDSILAGAGIIGIVIGFAVQDALKDIIRGMTILTDNYFSVGDVVEYNGVMGKVVSIGLATTKIEDIISFNVISIANRNIEQISVVSDSVDIMVPLSYELPIGKAERLLAEIVDEVLKIKDITNCEYKGVSKFKDSNIDYYLNFHCNPVIRRPMTRKVNGIILRVLEKNGVEIPYNQLDVHQK